MTSSTLKIITTTVSVQRGFLCAFFLLLAYSASAQFYFQNYRKSDGLASNDVYSFFQDSRGFIWIATSNGLSRFDGYEFNNYQKIDGDSTSLSDNSVFKITEDSHGHLWIGTGNGLNRYDPAKGVFTRFFTDKSGKVKPMIVYSIVEDNKALNTLWLATSQGLVRFNYQQGETQKFTFDKNAPNSINQTSTLSVFQDSTYIWVGLSGYGLDRLDIEKNEFMHFRFQSTDEKFNFRLNVIRKIARDPTGHFLLSTYGGLVRFDPLSGSYQVLHKQNNTFPSNTVWEVDMLNPEEALVSTYDAGLLSFDLRNNKASAIVNQDSTKKLPTGIRCVFVDKQQNVWIGSGGNGIFKASTQLNRMESKIPVSIGGKINRMFKDSRGDHWIGVELNGLAHLSSDYKLINQWNDEKLIGNKQVLCIAEDKQGNIWFGTDGGGLNKIYRETGEVRNFRFNNTRINSHVDPTKTLMHDAVTSLLIDRAGYLWVGTGFGINLLDTQSEEFISYYNLDTLYFKLNHSIVSTIVQLPDGHFAFGANGLHLYNKDEETVTYYRHDQNDSTSLSSNNVTSLLTDDDGLWVGTEQGLNRWNGKNFIRYNERHGLVDGFVKEIFKLDGRICTINETGISLFNKEANQFVFFNETEGFGDFHPESSIAENSNRALIGGNNAFYIFNPATVWTNKVKPTIYLTRILVLNKELEGIGQPGFLKEIILTHTQNILTLEFAALNYILPQRNNYAYKLDGFDNDWRYTDSKKRFATYTNLDPGSYTFRVRASNNDGLWNEEGTAILINVLPPPWRTWWAYLIYSGLFFWMLIIARRNLVQRERLKSQLKLELFEKDKLKELDEFKSKLFANISHEFRTPLTLILGKAEEELKNGSTIGNTGEVLSTIHRNGTSLLRLVNQMLDLSRIDAGKIVIQWHRFEIVRYLKIHTSAFDSLARQKNISFSTEYPHTEQWVSMDPYILEKIINNLISNALKYTPNGGHIFLKAEIVYNCFIFSVKDTGAGIRDEAQDKIFDRFYRVSEESEGTGIGLALTKELTHLLGGKISVSSEEGKGSEFKVQIPLTEMDEDFPQYDYTSNVYTGSPSYRNHSTQPDAEGLDLPVLLIVEDNDELRDFIKSNLQSYFDIIEARDGNEGLSKAEQFVPDIIVTDWMMPGLNGKELCERIKVMDATSHIPVVLLTAKAGMDSKIEGLETGANDYLTKPFEMLELKVRLQNLIHERNKLREKYTKPSLQQYTHVKVSSKDDLFIRKLYKEIERQLGDSNLTVEHLSHEMGVSRVQLHRKLTALTGHSANDLLRDYRLQRAADLLSQKAGNVSEIAFQVGFENLSYFSKTFKQKFKVLPSEYPHK